MNKQNLRIWLKKGFLHGEWSDRSLDDDERHLGIFITGKVKAKVDDESARKRLMVVMYAKYDQWIEDTGRR